MASIVVVMIVVALVSGVPAVNAVTYVGTDIVTDTTWTLANSPYRLTKSIGVAWGVTLTLEPGVKVDFDRWELLVSGTLLARGASDNKIVFYSASSYETSIGVTLTYTSKGTVSVIENAVFSGTGLTIEGSSANISNNYFANYWDIALKVRIVASPSILNNVFDCEKTAIYNSGEMPLIANNFIRSTQSSNCGIHLWNPAKVIGNNITGCVEGILVVQNGMSVIRGNLITNNTIGIGSEDDRLIVENNTITFNQYGFQGKGNIANNTIGHNIYGVVAYSPCNLNFNNLINNKEHTIEVSSNFSVNAENNWWGTVNETEVETAILDLHDDPSLGRVSYVPLLSQLNSNAPPLESIYFSADPLPTPYPTPSAIPPTPYPTVEPKTSSPTPSSKGTYESIIQPTEPLRPYSPHVLIPTPQATPGSPLTLGSPTFTETIAQFDLQNLAKLVVIGLCLMWVVIVLVSVDRTFGKAAVEKQ